VSTARRPWLAATALLLPTYAWLLLAVFLPLLAMLAFSFMNVAPFGNKPIVWTFRHYRAFADQPYLLGVAWTTVSLALWTTAVSVVLGLLTALAIVRTTAGAWRHVILLLVILPFWTNGLVRVFSWTMVLREGGFLDVILHWVVPGAGSIGFLYSRPAIVVGLVHAYLPYTILTCYVALVAIDESLVEAARSLGARGWTVFWEVILPLARPGLVSGAVLTFVPVVGSFMEPRILGGRVGVTLGTVIEDQFTQAFNWPLGSALSFTVLAAVLAVLATFSGVLRQGAR
jgi:spermidine/putrescine transport system permease protein